MSAFKQVIQNEAELREILGYAGKAAQNKVIPEMDDICRAFIEKSPFVLLGSTNADGNMDVSPKGDPAGFVQVMDSKTLLIPDLRVIVAAIPCRTSCKIPRSGCCFSCRVAVILCASTVRRRLCVMRMCANVSSCKAKYLFS